MFTPGIEPGTFRVLGECHNQLDQANNELAFAVEARQTIANCGLISRIYPRAFFPLSPRVDFPC